MSHAGMTPAQAGQYRELTSADEATIERLRRQRRFTQLREEYRWLKDFKVVLESPDGRKNASFRLEELFEMFTLTTDWREAVLP